MAKVKTYRSPKLGLVINAEPEVKRIEFVNGEFKTDDPKQQEYLENHKGFGLWIFADEQPSVSVGDVVRSPRAARKSSSNYGLMSVLGDSELPK